MSGPERERDTFEADEKSQRLAERGATEDSLGIDNTDTALSPEDTDHEPGDAS